MRSRRRDPWSRIISSNARIATPALIVFGLVNLPLSMLFSPTAAVLPNFYLEYSAVTLSG